MKYELPQNGSERNLDMNIKIFDKEAIFSIDSKVFGDELYSIIGNNIGRFNAERNNIFFYIFKDSKDYPQIAMRINRMGYKVREAGNTVWIRLNVPVLADKEINTHLEGKAFIDM
ncbi:MAG: hypothetical protein ACP5NO_08375, partial [Thermoplasmata archaeon]